MKTINTSYDYRIVDYATVHKLSASKFDKFIEMINPQENEKIIDIGAGYGMLTQEIIKRMKDLDIDYSVLEKSQIQIEMAQKGIKEIVSPEFFKDNLHFHNCSVLEADLQNEYYDKITTKSFLHEIPKNQKLETFQIIYRLLKENKKYLIWNYVLDNENCDFVRKLARKKDELAGFETLVADRYFLTENEMLTLLKEAGFKDIKEEHAFDYILSTQSRMKDEFGGNVDTLREWNAYILDLLKDYGSSFLKKLKFKHEGDDIQVSFKEGFYTAQKY